MVKTRATPDKRTGRSLAAALAIIFATLVVAWDAGCRSLANVVASSNPELALRANPGFAPALQALTDQQFSRMAQSGKKVVFESVALDRVRSALVQEPLSSVSVRQLALFAELSNDEARALRLMRLSDRLSRRDFLTRLWFIEHFVTQGDASAVLRHYDIALRTNLENRPLLFGQMVSALDDPALRRSVGELIRKQPPWADQFIYFAITNSPTTRNVADTLVAAGGLADNAAGQDLTVLLMARLINQFEFEAARRFYLSIPGAQPKRLTSLALERTANEPLAPPISWEALRVGNVDGAFLTSPGTGRMVVRGFAGPGARGPIARKLLFRKAGRYRLEANAAYEAMPNDAEATLIVQCVDGGTRSVIWRGDLRNVLRWPVLDIPRTCPFQEVSIEIAGSTGQTDAELSVSRVEMSQID